MKTTIKSLNTGDIHFFHPKVSAHVIAEHTYKFMVNDEVFSKINIFNVNGDIFDKSGTLDSSDTSTVIAWFNRVVFLCRKHNVKLRILHGTKSHDKHQTRLFNSIYTLIENKIDFKYIDDITIEYIDDFDRYVLYIPDDMGSAKSTLVRVHQLMAQMQIDKVDYACFHGFFDYQIPEMADSEVAHRWSDYDPIIGELIFISHVHTYSSYEKIVAPGSPERLRHGEEEDKGCIIATHCGENSSHVFLKNILSTKFITIKLRDDCEDFLSYVDKKVKKCNPGDHIKIKIKKNSQKNLIAKALAQRYPLLEWEIDWLKENKPLSDQTKIKSKIIKDIPINEDTIVGLIQKNLSTENHSAQRVDAVLQTLKSYLDK